MTSKLTKENISRLSNTQSNTLRSSLASSKADNVSVTSSIITESGNPKAKELKEAFKRFENREITRDSFVKIVQNDIGVSTTKEFEQKINRPDVRFSDVLKTLKVSKEENKATNSAVDPNLVNFRKFRKNVAAEPFSGTNPKKEELVVKSVQSLLKGEMGSEQFIQKLKTNDIPVEKISKEIRNFESSHQEKFKDFSSKIMRELGFKERNVPDSPTKMDTNILTATRDYERLGKEKEKQIKPKIDKVKQEQESRLVIGADGKPIYMHNRVKPSEEIKAVKTNGDFITWNGQKSDIYAEKKDSVIKKNNSHRAEVSTIGTLMNDKSNTPNNWASPRQKNLKLHQSSANFFEW